MSGRHEQSHLVPDTRGRAEFGPHGFGSQGSSATIASVAKFYKIKRRKENMSSPY